ncbi:Teneurin-1 [Eumeta japonica]|uniref:Teneurin-1 n=1 Tax=Eumeta variegata TaxID=151549 RepID=A0A4C1WJV6_EUMVA|nr:Teneurin-1 [Eumeta japonica]
MRADGATAQRTGFNISGWTNKHYNLPEAGKLHISGHRDSYRQVFFNMEKCTIILLLVTCAYASPQIKSVKGGQGNYAYNANSNLERFYGNNTTGYNNAQGHYTNTHNEFASGQSGYNSTQSEFHQGENGFTNYQSGYNQGQSGYNGAQSGYNQGQAGYNSAQSGYSHGQAGYGTAQTGYDHGQNGYGNAQSGYNQGQSGYNANQGGHNIYTYTPGGHNGPQDGHNLVLGRQNTTQGQHNATGIYTMPDFERGVCYIEVPTSDLVRNRAEVPRGNGSRPDLSRIRSCCKGYIRNIHNFKLCDPVCEQECVNGLCTAPNTCSCFPDHVKNAGGICIPTCPIGCQHGTCSGGECLCKDGYTLDSEGRYCLPKCQNNCGKQGNCTAPNTCECKSGYRATPSGGCAPHCDSCKNGDCIGPNVCVCNHGYKLENGNCIPECALNIISNGEGVRRWRGSGEPEISLAGRKATTETITSHAAAKLTRAWLYHFLRTTWLIPLYKYYSLAPGPGCGSTGRCVGPNVCECPSDQEFDAATRQCKPKCTRKCTNGECYGANTCRCHSGYMNNQVGDCIPQCSPGCGFYGECVAPNNCRCQPGYSSQRGECKPDAQPSQTGHNGQTGQYGQYGQHGGDLQEGQLVEQFTECSQPCINGVCSGGVCICNPGYQIDTADASGNRCIPSCPGGCLNGVCSGPNFCICNTGYVKDRSVKGTQRCVKRNKRSVIESNVADLLIYNIPDY